MASPHGSTPTIPRRSLTCRTQINVADAIGAALGVDARVSYLAGRQHGRAAGWQLQELGLGPQRIFRRERSGMLHRVHHGVYAVGYPNEARDARAMGAVLASGIGSAASHELASSVLAIQMVSGRAGLQTSSPTSAGRKHREIEIHRNCRLDPLDCTIVRGIPTTTGPRTLMDCAPRLDPDALYEAVGAAYRARVLDRSGLRSLLGRSRGLRGVALLRDATEELWMNPVKLRSELEARFLTLCRLYPTPAPLVNQRIQLNGRWIEVDFFWPELNLIVETDGFAFHADPQAHEEDRRRDQDLKLLMDIDVFRYTWRQVTRQPERVERLFDRYFGQRAC